MWKKKSRKGREAQNEVSVAVINDILDSFETNTFGVSLVDGCAGTGKTVLAISMINSLFNAVNIDDDILIENHKYIWNLTNEDWISRLDSRYTIGCIHTSQGYDMNYVGVIFGEEIDYDPRTNSIVVDLSKYMDKKVKAGTDESVLKELIINTYTTILARGIKGCYVYACNSSLRKYLKEYIATANEETLKGN